MFPVLLPLLLPAAIMLSCQLLNRSRPVIIGALGTSITFGAELGREGNTPSKDAWPAGAEYS